MSKFVKDFIYLDDERLRSYLAQIDGKLLEKTEKTVAHDISAGGSIKADGLSKLFLDADASADYIFQKSKSETSTLHHAAFELLLSKLKKSDLVNTGSGKDKSFSDIQCYLRLVDYSVLAQQLSRMGLLMPLFDKLSGKKPSQDDKKTAKKMKDMSETLELLYGNVKVLQLVSVNGKEILAQAVLDDSLSTPAQNFFQASSNNVLPGVWHVFCAYEQGSPALNLPTGNNEIAEVLATVADQLAKLKQVISATADAPNVIPIAIYRDL